MNISKVIVLATLLVSALPGLAQTHDPKPATAPTEKPAAKSKDVAAGDEQGAESVSETAAQTESSPYDYESTEQISEDRSVSFPVDI